MPAPQYVRRSYAGGVPQGTQLTAQIAATDTSFTIANTTGWTEIDGSPLGTVGPFTIAIDLYTNSVEKVLCSAINLSSGLVTVYTSSGYSGRGYDNTTAQAHVPGASPSGVQPCWSATEADEANQAVVLGPGGGAAIIGLTNNPAGRVHAVTGAVAGTNTNTPLFTTVTSDYLRGATPMTTSTHGLTVKLAGYYQIDMCTWVINGGASTQVQCYIQKNTSTTVSTGDIFDVASGQTYSLRLSDTIQFAVNDVVEPFAISSVSNGTMANVNISAYNYLAMHLVSV